MKTSRQSLILIGLILGVVFLLFGGGCASQGKKKASLIYYPPPPDEPRIQFLRSVSSSAGLVHVPAFKRFLMGPPPVITINKPYGVKMLDGKVYICDTAYGGVIVADFAGEKFGGLATVGGGKLLKPVDIDIDADGNRYVADAKRGQVLVYGPDSTCKWIIGDLEKSMKPADIMVSGNKLYVANVKSSSVQVYDTNSRKMIAEIPSNPLKRNDAEKLFQPMSMAMYENGEGILVSDIGGFRVQHYDLEGNYIKTIGTQGDLPGQFARPKGVAVDKEGRAYVVDAISEVVQIFNKDGRILMFFGGKGSPASFLLPADVEISYDGVELFREYIAPDFDVEYLVLVTSQFGPRKLSVFGFGRKKKL
jgi:YVTN family beta-propeller protein